MPSRSSSAWSTSALVVGVEADHGRGDFVEHALHGLLDTLAAVPVAAVAQLDGLVLSGRRAGGHRRPGERPVDRELPRPRLSGYRAESRISRAPTCSIIGTSSPCVVRVTA